MRIAICDDETLCIETLSKKIEKNSYIKMIHKYDTVDHLFSAVEDGSKYDLIFMDIDWKDRKNTGISYAQKLNTILPEAQIIFFTGYNDVYSQDIFADSVNLCGYLVKPVEEERLNRLIEKAYRNMQAMVTEKLILREKRVTYVIAYRAIIYIESKGHKLCIHTSEQNIFYNEKLDIVFEKLPNNFQQCHKSYVVNMDEVKRIERYQYVLRNEIYIPISKMRYNKSKKEYFEYLRDGV